MAKIEYEIPKKAEVDAKFIGWVDLLGEPKIKGVGVNDPEFVVYRGNIRQFEFADNKMNELVFEYHIPHGYIIGSPLYIHTHWSTKLVDAGNAKFNYEISYAKGYDRGAFGVPIIASIIQGGSAIAFNHQIAEVQFTDDGSSLIDVADIETDGVLLVRMYRDPADVDDTLTEKPFIHYVDVHLQVERLVTPNRNYPFD